MNIKTRRIISLVLAMMMIFSATGLMSVLADAAPPACDDYSVSQTNASAKQIESDASGKPLYFGAGAPTAGTIDPKKTIAGPAGSELYIDMAKSIKATDVENEFIITIDVETNSVVSNAARSDAAVVIVLDISGSMLVNQSSGGTVKPHAERRLTKAVNAINEFIADFADVKDANGVSIPGERWVSIVSFGSWDNIQTLCDWVNVGNETGIPKTGTALNIAKLSYPYVAGTAVGTLTGPTNVNAGIATGQYTCMSGGLSRALTQLGTLDSKTSKVITSVNTVLFTDGEPNQNGGLTGTAQSSAAPPAISGYTYSTRNDNFKWTENRAYYVREGSNLFTVAYGSTDHSSWLGTYIATKPAYNFASPDSGSGSGGLDLSSVFAVINNEINMTANAWTVTDPMGPNMEFVSLISNHKAGSVTEPGTALVWDLKQDFVDGSTDLLKKYTLSYKVRLNTAGIPEGNWNDNVSDYFPTNGTTTLAYTFEKVTDGTSIPIGGGSSDFIIPNVRGYRADFDFIKAGPGGELLGGFQFLLKKGTFEQRATSAAGTGLVSFNDIISGGTYVLSEVQSVPAAHVGKYTFSNKTYDVVVRYGEVFLFETGATKNNANVIAHFGATPACEKDSFTFVNPYDAGSLAISKADIGVTPYYKAIAADKAFEVTVTFTGTDAALALIQAPAGFVAGAVASGSATYTGTILVDTTATFPLVPTGVAYTVVETAPGDEYGVPCYTVNGGAEDTVAAGTIASTTNTVVIGNKMYADEGSTVTKTIAAGDPQGPFAAGDEVIFTIVVTNTGGYNITGLTFVDKINGTGDALSIFRVVPSGTEVWTNGPAVIVPGASETFKVYYTVTGNEGTAPFNKVDVKVTYGNGENEDKTDTESFTVIKPNVSIVKTLEGFTQGSDGKYTGTYQLLVTNNGAATAYDVKVSDTMTNTSDDQTTSGFKLGKIKFEADPTEYSTFAQIPSFNLAPNGGSAIITYTVTFNANQWKAEDLLSPTEQAELNAWLAARAAFETAKVALQEAIDLYNKELADVKVIADANEKVDMDDALAIMNPLKNAYLDAQKLVDKLYAQELNSVTLFEQAMDRYFEDLEEYNNPVDPENPLVTTEPVMPVAEDYLIDNSAAIEDAEDARDDAFDLYDAALKDYNTAAKAYADALKVDRELFGLTNREGELKAAKDAFDVLPDLSIEFDVDNLPGPHNYNNTATVNYSLTAGGTLVGPTNSNPVPVKIDPQLAPAMTINKLVSVDGGTTWQHIASFADATGGTAMFKMTIKNIGLAVIENITWEDSFDGADVTTECAGDTNWDGNLAVNQTVTLTWETDISNVGNHSTLSKTNVFSVTIPGEDNAEDEVKNATAIVIVPAEKYPLVTVNKEVKKGDTWVKNSNIVSDNAQNFEFRFALTNDGTAPAEVTLSDTFSYMEFNGTAYVATGATDTITEFYDVDGEPIVGTVTVPVGETVFVYATLTGINAGEYIVNNVIATYDDNGEEKEDTSNAIVSVTPQPKAYLSVIKKVVVSGFGTDAERLADDHKISSDDPQTLIFKISIHNRGSVAGIATIADIFPGARGQLYLSGDLENAIVNPYKITVPALSIVDLYYIVDEVNAGAYKNVAKITSEDPGTVIVDGEDDATVVVREIGKAHLTLNKEVRRANGTGGFVKTLSATVSSTRGTVDVEFRITVKNDGLASANISAQALTDAMVNSIGEDAMDRITTDLSILAVDFTLAGGESKSFIVLATIPVGTFVNTATLSSGAVEPTEDGDAIVWQPGEENGLTSTATVTVTVGGGGGGGGGGGNGGGGGGTPPPPPIVEIPEGEVPLDEFEIPEEEVPLAEAPYTGDESKMIPFAMSMLFSGAGLVLVNKKREEDGEEA